MGKAMFRRLALVLIAAAILLPSMVAVAKDRKSVV